MLKSKKYPKTYKDASTQESPNGAAKGLGRPEVTRAREAPGPSVAR